MAINDLYALLMEAELEAGRLGLDYGLEIQRLRLEVAADIILTQTASNVDVDGSSLFLATPVDNGQ